MERKSRRHYKRRELRKPEVKVWSWDMCVSFLFNNKKDAEEFAMAVKESLSVTGVTLYINGKFCGARDGMGS